MGPGTPDLNQARLVLLGRVWLGLGPLDPLGGTIRVPEPGQLQSPTWGGLPVPSRPPWTSTQCRGPVLASPLDSPTLLPWASWALGLWVGRFRRAWGSDQDLPAGSRLRDPVRPGPGRGWAGGRGRGRAGRGALRLRLAVGHWASKGGGSPLHPRGTPIPLHDLDCAAKAFPGLPELRLCPSWSRFRFINAPPKCWGTGYSPHSAQGSHLAPHSAIDHVLDPRLDHLQG